jgi:hypothetical protein
MAVGWPPFDQVGGCAFGCARLVLATAHLRLLDWLCGLLSWLAWPSTRPVDKAGRGPVCG